MKEKTQREQKEQYTKYEIARILGARALQLSMNAPLLLAVSKDQLEELNYDPLRIAELEFKANILPITVKRPLPEKTELDEKKEEELEIEEVEEKKEEKAEKEETAEEAEKETAGTGAESSE